MSVAGSLSGRNILVIEDEFFLADELERDLQGAGATIIGPFSQAKDARDSLSKHPTSISAAVLDVNIAGGNVFSLAAELQAAAVPFLFATGYDARAIPAQFAGMPRLTKPVPKVQLIDCLAQIAR